MIKTQILWWKITTRMLKTYMKALKNIFYELAPLIRDVTCSKLSRDGENILMSFCQTNTLSLIALGPGLEIWSIINFKISLWNLKIFLEKFKYFLSKEKLCCAIQNKRLHFQRNNLEKEALKEPGESIYSLTLVVNEIRKIHPHLRPTCL